MNDPHSHPKKPYDINLLQDQELKRLLQEYPIGQIDTQRYVNHMMKEMKLQETSSLFSFLNFYYTYGLKIGFSFALFLIGLVMIYSYWYADSYKDSLQSVEWFTHTTSEYIEVPASWETQLASGKTVTVPEKTHALIYLVDGSELLCSPQTTFRVRYDSLRNIHIQHGKVDIHASHQIDHPMKVFTPISTIDVIGTRFTVEILPKK